MAIPESQIVFTGQRITHRFHRGLPQVLDIQVLSENKKLEIAVKVLPTAEMEITFQNSTVNEVPFTSRLLWVNMAKIEGHDWPSYLDQKVVEHDYEAFIFSATGQAMSVGAVKVKAMRWDLKPIITMSGLNNDMGCLVFGSTMFLHGELDPEGPHQGEDLSGVHEFSIHVSAPFV